MFQKPGGRGGKSHIPLIKILNGVSNFKCCSPDFRHGKNNGMAFKTLIQVETMVL